MKTDLAKPAAKRRGKREAAGAATQRGKLTAAGAELKACSYTAAEVAEIFRRFAAANPEPKTELNYTNAFTLLVAVALSAQATDTGVNRATEHLFPLADTPQKMLALGEEALGGHIKTIGLWRNKAKNTIALARALLERFDGQVPRRRAELESLPGVGRKTANVVLNVVFGEPTMAVDTHIFRIGNRLGLARGKTPEEVERNLLKIIPPVYLSHAHHWLILHGRYICKARRPLCEKCIIADICKAAEKTNAVPATIEEYRAATGLRG